MGFESFAVQPKPKDRKGETRVSNMDARAALDTLGVSQINMDTSRQIISRRIQIAKTLMPQAISEIKKTMTMRQRLNALYDNSDLIRQAEDLANSWAEPQARKQIQEETQNINPSQKNNVINFPSNRVGGGSNNQQNRAGSYDNSLPYAS